MFAGNALIRYVAPTRTSRRKTVSAVDDVGDPQRQIANQRRQPVTNRGVWDRWPAGRHQIVQVALLAVILSFLVTTVPGMRAYQGHSWWMDGILQNLAYGAAAALCLVRTPTASPDRTGWRFLAVGLLSFGLSNVLYVWFARALDPMPVPTLCHLLWVTAYICVFIALVLLVRSRVNRLPLSLWLDGVVVGLGAATVAAVLRAPELVPVLGTVFAQTPINLAYLAADLLLLALVVGAMSLFRWRPPPSLWWLAGGLLVFGFVDCAYVTQVARGTYQPGGVVDAAWMIAVTVIALSPGWHQRQEVARAPATWLPLAAPPVVAAAAVSVLVAARYVHLTPVANCLAVATLLATLGRLAAAFFEARHAGEQAHLAQTDDLTGLLNRRGFYNQAAAILSGRGSSDTGGPTFTLLLLDLDHFKDVNDSLGHAAGDELLCRVAARLSTSLSDEDILARLGGDEFAVLLPHVGAGRAVQAAVALIRALEQPVVVDGVHVQTDASIGIALGPEHGGDLGTLLRHADIAMYRAKNARARYMVYTPDTDRHVTTRAGMELLAQLRHAIEHGDLAVHYQPKLSLRSGEMVGVEALVHWHHPERGLLHPAQFLPLARHNALMHAMTELVVDRALDRSFIASITEDPRAAAIVRSVIDLSHTLGLTTVAEGVETSDIAAVLSGYGCDIAQGHYFSHPVTAPELLNLITQPTHTTDRHLSNCVGGLRYRPDAGPNGSQQQ
jgi:diguanylate cyclase